MKIAFIGNCEPPRRLLDLFRKFTPNRSGVWGNLQGVNSYEEADIYGVIDYLPEGTGVDPKKCVFLGAHPETMQAYKNMDSYTCLAKADCRDTIGFLEWWLNFDYDLLSNLQPQNKTKLLGAIVANTRSQEYHRKRLEWLSRFCSRDDIPFFALHGRIQPDGAMARWYKGALGSYDPRGHAASGGNDHMSGKEEFLASLKFIVEFDATGANYWSERLCDDLLMWCYPLYWGGSGVHKYLPKESFMYINIDANGDDVLNAVEYIDYQKKLPAIAEARDLILNKYQIWARIHELVFGRPK